MFEHHETAKQITDVASVSLVLATLTAWLPPVAAMLSIFWTCLRIYESRTVQDFIHRLKND